MSSWLLPFFLVLFSAGISRALICAYGDLTSKYKFISSPNITHCKYAVITMYTPSSGNLPANLTVPYKVVVHPRQPYEATSKCYYNNIGYFGCSCNYDYCNSRVDIISKSLEKSMRIYEKYGKNHIDHLKRMRNFLHKLETDHRMTPKLKKPLEIEESSSLIIHWLIVGAVTFVVFFLCGIGTGAIGEWKEINDARAEKNIPGTCPNSWDEYEPADYDLKTE